MHSIWYMSVSPPAQQTEQAAEPVWSTEELSSSPHERDDKPERVRQMFARIAHAYDVNNRVHSLGLDVLWRKAAVRAVNPGSADRVLDVACGTGDLTRALAKRGPAEVIGLDFTPEMLDVARTKPLEVPGGPEGARIEYIEGDAMALPYPDDRFDVLTIAYGIRNVAEPAKAIAEFRRVLAPGGRLAILEFGEPSPAPVRWGHNLYTKKIMPWTATLIARDKSGAYRYLPKTVDTFMDADEMLGLLNEAGFSGASVRRLTFGVCSLFSATS